MKFYLERFEAKEYNTLSLIKSGKAKAEAEAIGTGFFIEANSKEEAREKAIAKFPNCVISKKVMPLG